MRTTDAEVIQRAARISDPSPWNEWREQFGERHPDLAGVDLSDAVLNGINLQFTDLRGSRLRGAKMTAAFDYAVLDEADLTDASLWSSRFEETQLRRVTADRCSFNSSRIVACNFSGAKLRGASFERCYMEDTILDDADLSDASFYQADLWMAFLRNAVLKKTNLRAANLYQAKLSGATIADCDLQRAVFVESDISGTTITDCRVFGVSAWDLRRDKGTRQQGLRVSKPDEAPLYVEDIEVAQFVTLMLRNQRIRDVIDTISRKAVLILGRFTPERKAVLDALRSELANRGFVPIIFDFEKPTKRDLEETVKVLAGLSRFVIADITNPSSSPLELHAIVPDYMIPFITIIQKGEKPFSMFDGLWQKYWWLTRPIIYPSTESLIRHLPTHVLAEVRRIEGAIKEAHSSQARTIELPD